MFKKKTIVILSLAFLTLVTVWGGTRLAFYIWGKPWILAKLAENNLTVKHISTPLFRSIQLVSLTGTEPFSLDVDRVTVRLNILGWLRFLGLDRPLITATVEGGTVQYEEFSIKNTSGEIRLLSEKIEGDFQGNVEGGGPFTLTFISDKDRRKEWQVRFVSDNFEIGPFIKTGQLTGRTAIELNANGPWPLNKETATWKVNLQSERLRFRDSAASSEIILDGKATLTSDSLTLHAVNFDNRVRLKGQIKSPLTKPYLQLHVSAEQWPLSHLQRFTPSTARLSGPISFSGTLNGTPEHPDINMSFSATPSVGAMKLTPVEGQFALQNKRLQITAKTAGGHLAIDNQGTETENLYTIVVKDVSLGAVADANEWKNVHGQLQANVQLTLNEKPELQGSFIVDQMQWGRSTLQEKMSGSVRLSAKEFLLTTEDDVFIVDLAFSDDGPLLKAFQLTLADESKISASGAKNEFSIQGKNIPPDIWPPLVQRYPEIKGKLDFSGIIKGKLNDPDVELSLVLKETQFMPEGRAWSGTTDFSWDHRTLAIKNLHIDQGYAGNVLWHKTQSGGVWKVKMELADASPQLLCDIFKSTVSLAGRLSGHADFTFEEKNFVGVSSMVWTRGQWRNFNFDSLNFDASFTKQKIQIEQVNLIYAGGALRGTGHLSPRGQAWDAQMTWHLQQIGYQRIKADGEISMEGYLLPEKLTGSFTLSSPVLWVNNIAFENLSAKVNNSENRLIIKGGSDPEYKFDISLVKKNNRLKARFEAGHLDIQTLLLQWMPTLSPSNIPQGQGRLSANITGTLDDPFIKTRFTIPELVWKKEHLSIEGVALINSSSFTLSGAKALLKNGGNLFLNGSVPFDPGQALKIEAAGEHLNLQSVFNILGWPIKWDGNTNATFLMVGPSDHRQMIVTFDGEHTGFGPFKQGGPINGVAVWKDQAWNLAGIRIGSGNGYAKLREGSQIYLDREQSGRMRLVADTRNLTIGLLTFFGQIETTGSWSGRKTEGNDPVELELFARSLWINQFVLDGNVSHLTLHKGRLEFSPVLGSGQQLSGILEYDRYPAMTAKKIRLVDQGSEKLFLDGEVGKDKWDFQLNTKDIDASVIRGLLDTTLPLSGPIESKITAKGSLDNPNIKMDLLWKDGFFGPLPLDTATGQLTYKNGILSATNINASKKKGYVLTGNMRFGDAKPKFNIAITKGNLAILESMWPSIKKARGQFSSKFEMNTIKGVTHVSGYLDAQNILLRSPATPNLKRGEIKMEFTNNILEITKAQAQMGRGLIIAGGTISFEDGSPQNYDLYLKTTSKNGASVRVPMLAIPPGPVLGRFSILKSKLSGISRGEPKVDVVLTGTASSPLLKGVIELENTVFTYPPPPTKSHGSHAVYQWFQDFARSMDWDLNLIAGDRTRYENELVSTSINGSLKLLGPGNDLLVIGRIQTEQGSIIYGGNEFKINEAVLEIQAPPPSINVSQPTTSLVYLKATAEKEIFYTDNTGEGVNDVITMHVDRALLGEIQPRFRSKNNPGLSSEKAFQLAMGIPLNESLGAFFPTPTGASGARSQEDVDRVLRVGLVQLLDSSLASPLARAIARRTGLVDFIRFTYEDQNNDAAPKGTSVSTTQDPLTPGADQNAWWRQLKGTKVKLGRELTNRLFADYSFKFDEYENTLDFKHEIELSYRIRRSFFIRATSELDTERTLGRPPDRKALLENRWRFGLPKKVRKEP